MVDDLDPVIAAYSKDYGIARKISALEEKRQALQVDVDDAQYAKKTAEEAGKSEKSGQIRSPRCGSSWTPAARRSRRCASRMPAIPNSRSMRPTATTVSTLPDWSTTRCAACAAICSSFSRIRIPR